MRNFYVLVTPKSSTSTMVDVEGKLFKTRLAKLAENAFPDLFHVMLFLTFSCILPLHNKFFLSFPHVKRTMQ